MTVHVPTVTLNNGVADADPRLRGVPDPRRGDRAGGHRRPGRRLPAPGHRRVLRQRGGRRAGDRGQRDPPRGAVRHDQAVGAGRRRGAHQAGVRRLAAPAGPGLPRPVPDPPALRRLLRLLAGDARPDRAGPGAGRRGVELLPGPARGPDRPHRVHPGGQPDRDPPLLPAPGRPGPHGRARRAARVLGRVRRGPQQPVHRPDPDRDRRRARQVRRPGRAALADPARHRRHPQVGAAASGWRRTWTSSTSPSPSERDGPDRRAWTPAPPCSSTTATPPWSASSATDPSTTERTHPTHDGSARSTHHEEEPRCTPAHSDRAWRSRRSAWAPWACP